MACREREGANLRGRLLVGVVIAVTALAGRAVAEEPETPGRRGMNEFALWGGASVAPGVLFGEVTDFNFYLAALRYGRTLWTDGNLSFIWTIDVIPFAILANPIVHGSGLAPLGFRMAYVQLDWLHPYFEVSGGFLYFTDIVPTSGSKFNFTIDLGVGVQIPFGDGLALTLGYTYHHISNGGISVINPGFDSNILYAGFSIFL